MIGKTISHYNIIEKLGEGGMGEVYLADDLKLERQVAIKFLPEYLTKDKENVERFEREAKAAAALNHPNIVTIHDVIEADSQIYIVMEYVDGDSLREKIDKGASDLDEVLDITKQICEGLSEAHKADIVHRDIKPENILIDSQNRVKILDFGLAKLKGVSKLTKETSTLGTIHYMSPEQIQGKDVDHRSDIWSLGVVLYEMLTGEVPFSGDYEQAVMYSILNEEPEPIQKLRPDITSELLHVVNRALEKDAADRYQSINEMTIDLRRLKRYSSKVFHNNIPVTSDPSSTEQNTTEVISKNKSTNFFNTRNIAVGLVIILIFAILYIYFPNQEQLKQKTIIPAKHTQITFTGKARSPEISPDGSLVAYITDRDSGEQKVVVQDTKGGKPLIVFEGKLNEWAEIRWTPDGSKISVPANKDGIEKIYQIPRLGGESRQLEYYDYHSYSPDGKKMACAKWSSDKIWIVDMESGETSTISLNVDHGYMYSIDWSPDGVYLLYSTMTGSTIAIWITKTDGSGRQKILERPFIDWMRWAVDGKSIYYLASAELKKINFNPVSGEVIGSAITLQSGLNLSGISISSDNRKLLTTKQNVQSNIYTFQRTQNDYSIKPLTSGTSNIIDLNISPDGKNIVFSRNSNIWVISSSGGTPKQLTFNQKINKLPVWSPDGKEIAYCSISEQGKKAKVWRMNYTGGTPRSVNIADLNIDGLLYWAPGKDILYQNLDGNNFCFHNPETGKERSIVKGDSSIRMWFPCYSPDLNKIAVNWEFNEQGKRKLGLWTISLVDSTKTQVSDKWLVTIGWSSDGKWIYFSDFKNPSEIRMINVKTGKEQPFYTLPVKITKPFYIFMTSNAEMISAIVENRQTDILMLDNFDPDVE